MLTEYVSDAEMRDWEDWPRAYRYGVLLIFPPDPPRQQVDALRARCDPKSHANCGAHISLTVPLPRPVTQDRWRELEIVVAGFEPITVRYGPLTTYPPHPGVVLAIEPQHRLDRLRRALEAAPVFAGAAPRKHPFSAHMTIAEFITVEETRVLMQELEGVAPQGSFRCDHVAYAVPDAARRFSQRGRLPLGAESTD